jgi:hypothetical protein
LRHSLFSIFHSIAEEVSGDTTKEKERRIAVYKALLAGDFFNFSIVKEEYRRTSI